MSISQYRLLTAAIAMAPGLALAQIPPASGGRTGNGPSEVSLHLVIAGGFALLIVILAWRGFMHLGKVARTIASENRALQLAQQALVQQAAPPSEDDAPNEDAVDPPLPVDAAVLAIRRTRVVHDEMQIVERRLEEARALTVASAGEIDFGRLDGVAEDEVYGLIDQGRSMANSLVLVGLLGTISGLSLAVLKMQAVPKPEAAEAVPLFIKASQELVGSFGAAFVAAGCGVLGSLILSARANDVERSAEKFLAQLRRFTLMHLRPAVESEVHRTTPRDALTALSTVMSETRDNALLLQETCQKLVDSQTAMTATVDQMRGFTRSLTEYQELWSTKQIDIINHVSDGAKAFKDIQEAMLTSSLRMEAAVRDGADRGRKSTEEILRRQESILGDFSNFLDAHQKYVEQIARLCSALPEGAATAKLGVHDSREIDELTKGVRQLSVQVEAASRKSQEQLRWATSAGARTHTPPSSGPAAPSPTGGLWRTIRNFFRGRG